MACRPRIFEKNKFNGWPSTETENFEEIKQSSFIATQTSIQNPYVVYKSELFSNFKKRKFLLKITKISAVELQLSENLLWHKIRFENIYNVCCEVECND